MNIFEVLNKVIDYIENNLEEDIDYKYISKMVRLNENILKQLFSLILNISISNYVRYRRLTCAGIDLSLNKEKVIDVALKYNYKDSASFSRAFEAFHGIKPSKAKLYGANLKNYPRLALDDVIINNKSIPYEIIELEEETVYGKYINTDSINISTDAPNFWSDMNNKYKSEYGDIKYGVTVTTETKKIEKYEYWILYEKNNPDFKKFIIPKRKYFVFHINSYSEKDIQNTINVAENKFLSSLNLPLLDYPQIEYYHDGVTDFYLPM